MGHGKETPRQKMIGMMYLVLMAMLALNVSNEVLNAFAILDEGLNSTKGTIEQTNVMVMDNFQQELDINPTKVKKWYDLADEVHKRATEIVNFIHERKVEMLKLAGEDTEYLVEGTIIKGAEIKSKDKTDAPAMVMVGDNNDKAGRELKIMLNDFQAFIMSDVLGKDVSAETVKSIESSLETKPQIDHKSKEEMPWEKAHFEHLPISGVLAIMTGLQINVRNAESEVLKYLYANIDKGAFKFNNLEATVIPNSNYIIKGNSYNAEIFLAASDTTATPTVYITESRNPYDSTFDSNTRMYSYSKKPGVKYESITVPKSGKALYKMPGSSIGERHWGGIIEMTGPGGVTIIKPFKRSYMVAEGSVVVSPTKMNVFYLGVDNPIDVSVAGVSPDKISIEVTNGKTVKKDNSYIMRPIRPGNSLVQVYAMIDGQKKKMGEKEFRVKKVPDPIAKINGITGGGINKSVLLAQVGVAAEMENFDFDLTFTVTEFTISSTMQGFLREETSKSYKLTQAQKLLIENLSKGQRLYIQDIKAVGPDGSTRSLPAIALLLN